MKTGLLATIGTGLLASAAGPLFASEIEARVRECALLRDDVSRLACYDAAVRRTPAAAEDRAGGNASNSPPLVAIPPASVSGASAGAATARAATNDSALPGSAQPPGQQAAQSEPTTTESRRSPPPMREERKERRAVLVSVQEDPHGYYLFRLDNGEVWRQMRARFVSKPRNLPVDVTMREGTLGADFIQMGEDGPMIKVRRIR